MALKITITDAGRAALINANKSGTRAVSIISVGVSGTSITADKSASSLPDEIKRISTISGKVTALDTIHLTAKDDGSDVYTIRAFALYLDDGTLFAIYGQSSPILEKSAAAMLLLQLDIRFVDVDATQIQFGNLDFINPAATEKTAGITRLTTLGEAEQSTENIAVSPVELRRYAEKLARQADMIAALATKFDKTEMLNASDTQVDFLYANRRTSFQSDGNNVWYGTDGVARSTIKDGLFWTHGSISTDNVVNATGLFHVQSWNGLNALDMHSDDDGIVRMYGKNANVNWQGFLAFNPQGNIDFYSPTGQCFINGQLIWNKNNDGAGSGLDADLLDGLDSSYFAANSRIETFGFANGLGHRIDDHIELHLNLDNVIGVITLPRTFNNIVYINVQLTHDTSRAAWATVESWTNNTVTISAYMMRHGNLDSVDRCGGFLHVYGN